MQSHATETNQIPNTMILFLFSIFNVKKLFSIVSPPTFHLAPRSLQYVDYLKDSRFWLHPYGLQSVSGLFKGFSILATS